MVVTARMSRRAIPVWCFALTVVKKGHRFLLVHERKHGERWYLPAGRLELGEDFFAAARRETLEESGIPIELEGILRIEHTPGADGSARMRVVFLARPADDRPPKSTADAESLEARWVTLDELDALPLRGEEVRLLFEDVLAGAPVYPVSLLQAEGRRLLPQP